MRLARRSTYRIKENSKQYLTSGVYDQLEGRQRLDIIDELLTHTSLEVLPLWLLGSNVAQQEIARRQAEIGAYDPEVDREPDAAPTPQAARGN